MAADHTEWSTKPFPFCSTPISALAKDQKPDVFEQVATEMALAHNLMLRALNAIYQQAPYVKDDESNAFVNYCLCWCRVMSIHHDGEEDVFFPYIEKVSGEKGLMETNVAQHAAFHDGVLEFEAYLNACERNEETYDGERLRRIIDGFGVAFSKHLLEEIPSLLSLKKFGEEKFKDLYTGMKKQAAENFMKTGPATGVIFCLVSHDNTFENGLWSGFPAAPWIALAAFRYGLYHMHSDWWKFAPSDQFGTPKPQYAVPPGQ